MGQPGGEGRRKAPATPPQSVGPKAFGGRSGCPPTFRCPRVSRSGGWSPWGEARGLAEGVAWAGLSPQAGVGGGGACLPPAALWLFLLFVLLLTPALCPVIPPLNKSSVPVPSVPTPSPKNISYHCCICNLWTRGLTIYYYWLIIIIIIDYVNLPPVCLSRCVSEVTPGVEDALVPRPRPTPKLSRRQCSGPLVGPHHPGGRSHGPFSPPSVLVQGCRALWLLSWGAWRVLLLRHWSK